MRNYLFIFMTLGLLIGPVQPAQGWWIFGRSRGEVELRFLQINNVRFEEADGAVALARDLLDDGRLIIRGRARAGRARIGAVEVSVDNQETWQSARIADDGTFEFIWRPEEQVEYIVFIKAVTTTGQSNRVEDTRLEVTLLDQDMRSMIVETLSRLVTSYQNQDINGFMQDISRNFAGDNVILDRAVRNDFSLFDNINLRFNLNSLAVARNGSIVVNISFNRSLISSRTGEPFSDRGHTEFTFVQEGGGAKVWAMRAPLLFGLSDAAEVATGVVRQSGDPQLLIVTDDGQVTTAAAFQVEMQAEGIEQFIFTGDIILNHQQGFNFASEMKVSNQNQADLFFNQWDAWHRILSFARQRGGKAQVLASGSLDNVNEVPANGYDIDEDLMEGYMVGTLYAVRTPDGKYAVIEIVNIGADNVRIRYKYQPDGSRFF